MGDAISSNDFKKAGEIEKDMSRCKEVLEVKRPLSRFTIEHIISETQIDVDDSLAGNNF